MSKRLILLLISISAFFISCEENFDPYGDYLEKFAFTCILRNDQDYQTATLSRSYRPDGFDPYTNTTDPSVTGADIRVWYNDSVFVFKDTSVVRSDTSRYNTPFHFYYNNNFFVGIKKTIELEVLLPTGRRLSAYSTTPGQINFEDNSDVLIPPPAGKNTVQILWKTLEEGTFFLARMAIRYEQKINGEVVYKEKDVPIQYISQGEELTPIYPSPSASIVITYDLDAVTKTLEEISSNDPVKSSYAVYQRLIFSVTAFDQPASRYISSTGGTVDDLTVSVDVADYTNIQGGFGLFASYSKRDYTKKLRFLEDYITAFGYNFIVEN